MLGHVLPFVDEFYGGNVAGGPRWNVDGDGRKLDFNLCPGYTGLLVCVRESAAWVTNF